MDIIRKVGQTKSKLIFLLKIREKEIIKKLIDFSHNKLSDRQLIKFLKLFFNLQKMNRKI